MPFTVVSYSVKKFHVNVFFNAHTAYHAVSYDEKSAKVFKYLPILRLASYSTFPVTGYVRSCILHYCDLCVLRILYRIILASESKVLFLPYLVGVNYATCGHSHKACGAQSRSCALCKHALVIVPTNPLRDNQITMSSDTLHYIKCILWYWTSKVHLLSQSSFTE